MEQKIVVKALENLFEASGLVGEINFQPNLAKESKFSQDGAIHFLYKKHSFKLPFIVKKSLTNSILDMLQEIGNSSLVIFKYASKTLKKQLKKYGINYIEITGNAYIETEEVYFFVDVNKSIKPQNTKNSKAFSKTGLKLIYLFLSHPETIKLSYREIANISNISIDTIGRILRELVNDNYVVKYNDLEHRIFRLERLAKDWAIIFNKTLRPKLKKRAFDFRGDCDLRSLLNHKFKGKISGELAADEMSNYLISEKANIYINGSFVDFALSNNLIPSKSGRITLIEQFWDFEIDDLSNSNSKLASPILVYSDLIDDYNPRNINAAKKILDNYVYNFV